VYPVLKAAEESGRVRRGYFVEGLGAAQFALPGAVDRLRTQARDDSAAPAHVLAATDPANPYGAALPWPERPAEDDGKRGHQPARKAGALVVVVGGRCALGKLSVERADGTPVVASPLGEALEAAGFRPTPRGLRLRA